MRVCKSYLFSAAKRIADERMRAVQLKYAHVHRTREIRTCDQFLALLSIDFDTRDLRPRCAKCVKPERREDRGHHIGCEMYGRVLRDVRKAQ